MHLVTAKHAVPQHWIISLSEKRPVMASMLALMAVLIGLLGLMLSLSLVLRSSFDESAEGLLAPAVVLSLFAMAYLVLAYGLWTSRRWTRTFCIVLLGLVMFVGVGDILANEVMALDRTLLIGLAFLVNIAVFMALQLPAIRAPD